MLQIFRETFNWFCQYYSYFWLASIVAIPYLSYRSKQTDFNMVDGFIMYATVFIGAYGLIQNDRRRRPR
ncbi:hypothetical protein M5D96_006403 [Drosophila gunungcola]|uniref:Uncharacterized protein n=1 Tax=Drosophila gunungcola TaxID=103775 RepID=A0A9Q0BQS8_9MUSC|nr:hypothetical protein M5D96_006403 [Drosophila gunungcola]